MVTRANKEYDKLDLKAVAKKHKLDGPWQVITVASLVQVEGKTHDDFRKMAEVVYNRLKPTNTETNQLLQFDSAFNYLNNQSNIKISESEILSNKDPYNTYTQKGLTRAPSATPVPMPWPRPSTPRPRAGSTSSRPTASTRPSSPRPTTSTSSSRKSSMPSADAHRAAVLGSPIAHSLSPVLHRAAYAGLGLDGWSYDRFEVDDEALPGFIEGLDRSWAGLS